LQSKAWNLIISFIVDRVGTLDTLEVQVEVTDSQFINADEVKVLQEDWKSN